MWPVSVPLREPGVLSPHSPTLPNHTQSTSDDPEFPRGDLSAMHQHHLVKRVKTLVLDPRMSWEKELPVSPSRVCTYTRTHICAIAQTYGYFSGSRCLNVGRWELLRWASPSQVSPRHGLYLLPFLWPFLAPPVLAAYLVFSCPSLK